MDLVRVQAFVNYSCYPAHGWYIFTASPRKSQLYFVTYYFTVVYEGQEIKSEEAGK